MWKGEPITKLHVKLLVEHQRHISYVKVGMYNYCFNRVSDYMFVIVMVFVIRFGRVACGTWWLAIGWCYVGAFGSCLFNNVSFLSYFLTLTPSVNGHCHIHWSMILAVMAVLIVLTELGLSDVYMCLISLLYEYYICLCETRTPVVWSGYKSLSSSD